MNPISLDDKSSNFVFALIRWILRGIQTLGRTGQTPIHCCKKHVKRNIQRPMGSIGFVGLVCDYVNYICIHRIRIVFHMHICLCEYVWSYFIVYSYTYSFIYLHGCLICSWFLCRELNASLLDPMGCVVAHLGANMLISQHSCCIPGSSRQNIGCFISFGENRQNKNDSKS